MIELSIPEDRIGESQEGEMNATNQTQKTRRSLSLRLALLGLAWLLLALALASCLPGGDKDSSAKGTGPADLIEGPQLAGGARSDFVDPDREENEPGQEIPDACAFLDHEQAGDLLDQAFQEKALTPEERSAWAGAIEKNGTGWIWQCGSSIVPV